MERVLIVEDDPIWQGVHKRGLEHLLGVGSVDVVDNYDAALSMLTQSYAAYVIDGEFPKSPGEAASQLGVPLAQEIYKRENNYDKVFLVSGKPDVWKDAHTNGIPKVYNKGSADKESGVGDITKLMNDLINLLGR